MTEGTRSQKSQRPEGRKVEERERLKHLWGREQSETFTPSHFGDVKQKVISLKNVRVRLCAWGRQKQLRLSLWNWEKNEQGMCSRSEDALWLPGPGLQGQQERPGQWWGCPPWRDPTWRAGGQMGQVKKARQNLLEDMEASVEMTSGSWWTRR